MKVTEYIVKQDKHTQATLTEAMRPVTHPLSILPLFFAKPKCFHTLDFKFAGALTISLPLSAMFEMHQ